MRTTNVMPIRIEDSRPDFDKACNDAYRDAVNIFGIHVDGYSTKAEFIRNIDTVYVKFVSYEHIGSMIGHSHVYKFETWIEREEDE